MVNVLHDDDFSILFLVGVVNPTQLNSIQESWQGPRRPRGLQGPVVDKKGRERETESDVISCRHWVVPLMWYEADGWMVR